VTEIIYNGYTKDELNLQYNMGLQPYMPDGSLRTMHGRPQYMKDSALRNKEYSENYLKLLNPQEDIPYNNEHPKQVFDLYKAKGDNTPLVIMLSGGQYMRGRTKVWSQWSKKILDAGISFIDLDHPQIPDTTLPDMVENAENFMYWIKDEAPKYGLDNTRIIVAGHSSGASVMASVLVRLANDGNSDGIKGMMMLSGNYDLIGPALSFRQDFLKLSDQDIINYSAIRNLIKPLPPMFICCGALETDEMKRQQRIFHDAVSLRSQSELVIFPTDHFAIGMELYDNDSKMWKFIINHI
jgi:arylformamidase